MTHPHNLQWFESNRPDIVNFVKRMDQTCLFQHILIIAPVKSGKREIMETFAVRSNPHTVPSVKHFYLSALNRKDDKPQLEELELYGISVYLSGSGQSMLDEIQACDANFDKFVVHFNESDYGTGHKQLTSKIFPALLKNPKVQIVAYSATQEEAMRSDFSRICQIQHFTPPSIYCGTKWYLDNNRVIEAEPFWDEENAALTEQGIECCERLKNGVHIFGVVRIPYKMHAFKTSGLFENAIRSRYGFNVRFISGNDSFDWSDNDEAPWKSLVFSNKKTILVVCQTATRSTELKFHKYISFWHGAERKNTAYNTIIQADGRPIFYNTPENGPVDIMIYTSVNAFKLNAGYISYELYDKKLSQRSKANVTTAGLKSRLELRWMDKLPTLDEFNAYARAEGAYCNYTEVFNRTVSGHNKLDMAESLLRPIPVLMGRITDGVRYACTVHFDNMNPHFTDSWRTALNNGVAGKYAIALEFDEMVSDNVIHITTRSSMYQHTGT